MLVVLGFTPRASAQCTDADGDGFYFEPSCGTPQDCDDANPACTTDCTDADSDGFCVTTDCDEADPSTPIPTTSWWPGDGSASDVSGGGNHAVVLNGASFAPGVAGEAFSFEQVTRDDRVDLPHQVLDGVTDLTVEFWVKITSTATHSTLLDAATSSGQTEEFLLLHNRTASFIIVVKRSWHWVTGIWIDDGAWHHLAVTREGSTVRLYLDGTYRASHIFPTGALDVGPGGLILGQKQDCLGGCFEGHSALDGLLDEVAIFHRVLTAEEITTIYDAGSAGKWCLESTCDGLDDNANGAVDEGCDDDGDGYCDEDMTVVGTPSVCPHGAGDCDDTLASCTIDCTDGDGDTFCVTHDCDDSNPNCTTDCTDADSDGFCITFDCDDATPTCTTDCTDNDLDGLAVCHGDCDDGNPTCTTDCTDDDGDTFCVTHDCDDSNPDCTTDCTDGDGDGFCVNHDCDDASLDCTTNCLDVDADGFRGCDECDDSNRFVFPGAVQLCDGINNDCDDTSWPTPPADEVDADGDGFRICSGECNDADASIHPMAPELCNGIDDDCNGLTDDDADGEDSDGDSVFNVCDNCPTDPNRRQDDLDSDLVGDVCDNCVFDPNPSQTDSDDDLEGDRCDYDDGLIYLYFDGPDRVGWDVETGFDSWNCYVGDLEELENSGVYTQAPGSNPLADRGCSLGNPYMDVMTTPGPGKVAFQLVTGMSGGVESSLGNDSSGMERPNDSACASLP
jgi:hypothetical protein